MRPVRTKDDLLDLAARLAPTTACGRVIREQGATVLGGFIAAEGFPSWIVLVRGRENVWIIRVTCNEVRRCYTVDYLREVPWVEWIGRSDGRRPLIDGDNPKDAAFKRMEARRHNEETTRQVSGSRRGQVREDSLRPDDHTADGAQLDERGQGS